MTGEASGLELIERIRHIARNHQTIDIAQFHFIGLDEVKAAYGERWGSEHDRIQDVARSFITKRIQSDDVLIPCDNGFVVVFGAADSIDAAVTAHTVGQALNGFFLGEEATKHFKVAVMHEAVPAQELSSYMSGVRAADATKASRGEIHAAPEAEEAALGFRFQPVWDVKHEAVMTYYAEPFDLKTGERIAGYQFEDCTVSALRLLEVDERTLRASEVALRTMFDAGKKAILGVSLHVRSLMKLDNRARLLSIISQFDPNLARYRVLKISGVAPGFPRLYLKDTVSFLAARVPHVIVGMSADEEDFSTALDCGAWGLGYTIPPDSRLPSDQNFQAKLRKDVTAAQAHQKRFYLEGQLTARQAFECARCKVDFLASPLVWSPATAPGGVFGWAASRLMADA